MAAKTDRKPVGRMTVFGLLTVAMYAAVFTHAEVITSMFARGSLWAAGPIATVFAFSYVHGTFASDLWSVLGVNARPQARKAAETTVARPSVRATVKA